MSQINFNNLPKHNPVSTLQEVMDLKESIHRKMINLEKLKQGLNSLPQKLQLTEMEKIKRLEKNIKKSEAECEKLMNEWMKEIPVEKKVNKAPDPCNRNPFIAKRRERLEAEYKRLVKSLGAEPRKLNKYETDALLTKCEKFAIDAKKSKGNFERLKLDANVNYEIILPKAVKALEKEKDKEIPLLKEAVNAISTSNQAKKFREVTLNRRTTTGKENEFYNKIIELAARNVAINEVESQKKGVLRM